MQKNMLCVTNKKTYLVHTVLIFFMASPPHSQTHHHEPKHHQRACTRKGLRNCVHCLCYA